MTEPGDLRDLILHDQDFDLDAGGAFDPETASIALGLGKLVAVGYQGNPTWIDPAAADWADVVANGFGWVQFLYDPSSKSITLTPGVGAGLAQQAIYVQQQATTRRTIYGPTVQSDDTNTYADVTDTVNVANDGSSRSARTQWESDLGIGVDIQHNEVETSVAINSVPGQTTPVLNIESGMLALAPDGSVGGVSPSPGDVLSWDGAKIVWTTP